MAALSARRSRAATARLLDEVFSPGVLGALERIRLRARHASGDRPGNTPVRGRSDPSGTEIDRHTTYTPGDDLRRIDWNVYARLGELLTRRYVAEREVPVWLVVDTSGSMGPPGPASKLDMAAAVAGIVAVVALAGGDRVYLAALPGRTPAAPSGARPAEGTASGGSTSGERPRAQPTAFEKIGPLRGRRSLGELHRFLKSLAPSDGPGDLAAGLDAALRGIRRGLVFLVSDFLVERPAIGHALDAIGARKCEGKIVQVLSREDRDPSWLHDRDTLIDRETGAAFHIDPSPETLARYEAAIAAHVAEVAQAAASRAMMSSLTVSDVGLREFLRTDLPRLGLKLVR